MALRQCCVLHVQAARRTSGDKRSPRTSGSGMAVPPRVLPTTPRDATIANAINSSGVRSPQTTSPPYQHITVRHPSRYTTLFAFCDAPSYSNAVIYCSCAKRCLRPMGSSRCFHCIHLSYTCQVVKLLTALHCRLTMHYYVVFTVLVHCAVLCIPTDAAGQPTA
jgi:hypothetical protein